MGTKPRIEVPIMKNSSLLLPCLAILTVLLALSARTGIPEPEPPQKLPPPTLERTSTVTVLNPALIRRLNAVLERALIQGE